MSLTEINVGTTANDGTGDSFRAAFEKVNAIIQQLNGDTPTGFETHVSTVAMVAGNAYALDTSGGAFPVTLPTAPTLGEIVTVIDYAGVWDAQNLTITYDGTIPIHRVAGDYVFTVADDHAQFQYWDNTVGWLRIR